VKYIEVELKFSLSDPAALAQRLADLGGQPQGENRQTDVYFNAAHRDFLAEDVVSEWLRLRTEIDGDGRQSHSINFKRWLPLGAVEATHCDEFESAIGNHEAFRRLLEALGFTEMVTVDKTRRQWRLGDVVIAVDIVANLGSFAEFEYVGDAGTVQEATSELHLTVDKIGIQLGERDRRGYPYQVLDRER